MWANVSDAERQISERHRENRSQNLPDTNDARIPTDPRAKSDAAPAPANDIDIEVEAEVHAGDVGDNGPDVQEEANPPTKKAHINTTTFPFWPDLSTVRDELPAEETGKEWLEQGLYYPDKEAAGARWYGVHLLGEGATGRVGLWVGLNEESSIKEVCAIAERVLKY
jgi:hypothetical protein